MRSKAAPHVALLRGVNVGGNNLLPMKDLAAMFTAAGCASVRTYIQSGNVVFNAAPDAVDKLPGRIAKQITDRFGYRTPVIIRNTRQIEDTLRNNPFLKAGVDESKLYVLFLAGVPEVIAVNSLDPARSTPDAFAVLNQEIYLHLPNGGARSKLTNAYFDSKLATISTARNWRTVGKLFELLQSL